MDSKFKSQFKKGSLDMVLLSIISQKETYGYEILTQLSEHGFEGLGEGTLYPILTRLDKNGFIACRKTKSPYGPIRKYYSITPEGEEHLALFRESYEKISACAQSILKDSEGKE